MKSEADLGRLPHWDLSNVYPGLESKGFRDAVSEAKAKLDDMDEYLSKHQISRTGARPGGAMELAEVISGYLHRMNDLIRLFGTLEAYVHSFVSTDSYNTTAKRIESELEMLGVRLERQGVFFQGWLRTITEDPQALPAALEPKAPLTAAETLQVFDLALTSLAYFQAPQDVEWTFADRSLYLLQSRPITSSREAAAGDQRGWYLSLKRSFENLKQLRGRIENELIPAMVAAAAELAAADLGQLEDAALAAEIRRRSELNTHWVSVYWAEFIPFAHGVRLFGQVYNDSVHPEDPYEFLNLLGQTPMAGLERNRLIAEMAALVRATPGMAAALQAGEPPAAPLVAELAAFIDRFGDLSCPASGARHCTERPETLINVILQLAAHPSGPPPAAAGGRAEDLKAAFLGLFSGAERRRAEEMLDLARASYQLRDDDNIHLGRIEARLTAALQEARRRLAPRIPDGAAEIEPSELLLALENPAHALRVQPPGPQAPAPPAARALRARQLVGQPAGPGVARGPARVIHTPADLASFQAGEILVCDAVDPNMTFFAPLSAGVVERRGGMLIHGAIIAREYGLPCVTGVPDATALIRTGDELTVDGFLGIVTVATGRL